MNAYETIKKSENKWYAFDIDWAVKLLDVNLTEGLSESEAEKRQQFFGKNLLPEKKKEPLLIKFFKHFNDILIYVLLVAGVITFFMAHYVDTIVIVAVAIINAAIGFFQEHKAEKALEDIKKMLSLKAIVVRSGNRVGIDASEITLGDLVMLSPGDKVPADLRLIRTDNLRIEESPLTGESVPIEKKTDSLPVDTMLGDRINMAFSSTTVSAGTGIGLVVGVGSQTEIGRINQMMSDVTELTTPLLKQIARFGKLVTAVILIGSALIFLFGYFFRHYEIQELLMSVIGLALAAIPEGLPAMVSIILAIGVQNMARRNTIVRTLPSVETLGSVSVICSDKTGTLTKNEMTVKTLDTRDGEFLVTGSGYAPQGDILSNNKKVDFAKEPVLKELIECFNICNEATLSEDEEGWKINGDPTEGSLITVFHKADIDHSPVERIATIPFDSEYKYMATLVEKNDHNVIYIKGAPDKLMYMAALEKTGEGHEPFEKEYWNNQITSIAIRGQRTIGAAYKIVDKTVNTIDHSDIHDGIVFLGLAGIIDPPRDEVVAAVATCKEAGIGVKMITGDHIDTARTIAKELGIGDGTKALQGKALEQMSDEEMEVAVMEYDVFARTSPEHKLRLVKALQAKGIICAMTGDGVNDAPALKKADIGIAMGIKGTEVTKDAAEIVLVDDNFSTIVAAVEEGRRVYDNLKKTILFSLPTNAALSLLVIASILFGMKLPLTPVQILWINMVTSVTISLPLAFETLERGAMKRPPRAPKASLLNGYFIWRIIFVSVLVGVGTLALNVALLRNGRSENFVQTITLQTVVLAQLFHLFNCRSIRGSAFRESIFSNKALLIVCGVLFVLQAAITYLPFMNAAFDTVPLGLRDWIYPFLLGFAVFLIVEVEKAVMRGIDSGREERVLSGKV
jgi:magnesium-transporting ATPase (P-type)